MKNEYRNYKKLKISVHISLYVDSKKKAQLKDFIESLSIFQKPCF